MTCTLHAKEAFIVFLPIPLLFIEHVRNFETNEYIFDLLKPHFRHQSSRMHLVTLVTIDTYCFHIDNIFQSSNYYH